MRERLQVLVRYDGRASVIGCAFAKVSTQCVVEIERSRGDAVHVGYDGNTWISWRPRRIHGRVLLPVIGIGDDEEGVHESEDQVRRCGHIRKRLGHYFVEVQRLPKV